MGKFRHFHTPKYIFIGLSLALSLSSVALAAFVNQAKGNFAPKFDSVAFIDKDIPSNSYYTIEDAIKSANSGSTIYVRPGQNPIFFGNPNDDSCNIIKENVTLALPVSFNNDGSAYYGWTVQEGEAVHYSGETSISDGENYNIYKHKGFTLTNTLTIAENATLINHGTIYIGGELTGAGGGGSSTGHTFGKYAKIHMMNNSSIICGEKNKSIEGNIKCLGYITEEEGANSNIYVHKGNLRMPFSVRDFKGGNASLSIYYPYAMGLGEKRQISPFSQYELRNIESRVHLSYYSSLDAYCNIRAGGQHNFTMGRIIGTDNNSLIKFTDSQHSRMVAKYNKNTEICDLNFYGGATMNSLKLSITIDLKLGKKVVDISTSEVYFPLTWRHNIHLYADEGQKNALYNIDKLVKVLPGSSIYIGKRATLDVNSLTSFDYSSSPRSNPGFNDTAYEVPGADYCNPSYPQSITNAKIIVDGMLKAKNLAGLITPGEAGTLLSISNSASITTYEAMKTKTLANAEPDTLINTARGILNNPNSAPVNLSALGYISQGTHWVVNDINYTIVYKSFMDETKTISNYDGNGNITSGNTKQNYTLNTPTYAADPDIKFAGWFLGVENNECVDHLMNNVLSGSMVAAALNGGTVLTIYAKWVRSRPVTIEYLSPQNINSTCGSFTNIAYVGVDFALPSGNIVHFDDINDPNNDLHRFRLVFKSWNLLDINKQPIEDCTNVTDSVKIPANYAHEKIYIQPTFNIVDLYKVIIGGTKVYNENIRFYLNEKRVTLGNELIVGDNWLEFDSKINVWVDWYFYDTNKIRIEISEIKEGKLIYAANNKWTHNPIESGNIALGVNGLNVQLTNHK